VGLDMPYNLVREGRWTLDEYEKYVKAATNLHGEENWRWSVIGGAIYGHASYHMGATAMLFGTDVTIIDFDEDNMPFLAVENEHFFNAVQRLSSILSIDGQYLFEDAAGVHRHDVFAAGRSLFADGPIGNNNLLREVEENYGILPVPKFDERQENYVSIMHAGATFTTIPATNSNPSKAAMILDAMAYHSYIHVRPAYFDVVLSNKQLRNEDSIDMLQIILDTRSVHIGYVYNWTTNFLHNAMRAEVQRSSPNTASVIETHRERINANIQTTIDFFMEGN
jgi:hypothetical protein